MEGGEIGMTLEEMQEKKRKLGYSNEDLAKKSGIPEHCTESHGRCDKASQKSDDDCFGGYAEPESEAHDL